MSRPLNLGRVALLGCLPAAILSGCGKKEVASVNGAPISRTAFSAQLEKDYGSDVLQRLINRLIVDQALQKAGLTFAADKVEQEVQRVRDQAGSDQAFQQYLGMQGWTEDSFRLWIEMNMKLDLLAQKDIKVTEQDLKAYYKENEPRYDRPVRVKFSEIALATRAQADDVRKMALKPGASFADLAKQYSHAPTQPRGGQRATMAEPDIVPVELRDSAMKLPTGQVSEPIKTSSNLWYIILVHERLPAKKLTFEEAREAVQRDCKGEKMVPKNQLFQQLLNDARVQIVDARYAGLQRVYMGSAVLQGAGAPTGQPPVGGGAPQGRSPAGRGKAPALVTPPEPESKAGTK